MKITEVRKKVKKVNELLKEYNDMYVLLKHMQRHEKEVKIDEIYFANVEKRMFNIETEFENLLK